MITTASNPRERDLLAAACGGDPDAFRLLVEPHRRELQAHCYRMLSSLHDAEDAFQEGLLRAWRGLCRFNGRSTFRRWLYRIATNTCLDALARRPKRVLPIDYDPPAGETDEPREPVYPGASLEPYPDDALGLADGYAGPAARYDRRESVELAVAAALRHLPPRQRAVLILREVLGFSAREAADALGTTVASVNSALQRARHTVDERLPEDSEQESLQAIGDEATRVVVRRFVEAFERGDVRAVVALLAHDVHLEMPPSRTWSRGRGAVPDSWLARFGAPDDLAA